jgi:hypothetical protein
MFTLWIIGSAIYLIGAGLSFIVMETYDLDPYGESHTLRHIGLSFLWPIGLLQYAWYKLTR